MSSDELLIVGLGASAGGIKAFREFFEHVPADSGIAYVVILHLSPDHDSRLAEVLQASASIPVTQVRDRVRVEPNHVYVVPTNQSLTMVDGYLEVSTMRRIKERRAVNEELRSLTEDLETERIRKLLKRLVTIQEDERRRVARDLHDHLGQQITALRLTLESIKTDPAREEGINETVAEAQRLSERLDRDLDLFTSELRPPALDDLGLVTALEQYAAEWSRNTGVPSQFQSSGLTDVRLASDLDTNLYRIAQEALNNVHKHAQASRVDVFIGRRDGQIVLIVEDNGRGFQPPEPAGEARDRGFGLLGMRERAALMGGQLEIETDHGSGTSVFVKVPASFIRDD